MAEKCQTDFSLSTPSAVNLDNPNLISTMASILMAHFVQDQSNLGPLCQNRQLKRLGIVSSPHSRTNAHFSG